MMYLDDFMEILEFLPSEIKSDLDEIRRIDTDVVETMERTQRNVDNLFANADKLIPEELDATFQEIMKDSQKAVDQSDMKIEYTNHMQGMLSKYMKRLDKDLLACKMELEEGNIGSTDIIEKRVLESDQSNSTNQEDKHKLNRCLFEEGKRPQKGKKKGNASCKKKSIKQKTSSASSVDVVGSPSYHDSSSSKSIMDTSTLFHSLGQIRVDISPNAAAVSQDNSTTSQSSQGQNKKDQVNCSKTIENQEETQTEELVDIEEPIDPNGPRYCFCNEVAYGLMIACDAVNECKREWFHYECVGISEQPEGKWFCRVCTRRIKDRKRRRH